MVYEVDLIIFDLDGTLVDSKEALAESVNFTLRALRIKEKSVLEISSYIGTGVEDLILKSLGRGKESLLDKALDIFEGHRRSVPDTSKLYLGVKDVLEYFSAKKKAVLTNRKYEFAVSTLKILGIHDCFVEVLGGDDYACKKPSSCSLEQLLKRLDVRKEKSMIVGDMDIDIMTGKNTGILTCAVTYGIGRKEDILKAGPDYVIESLSELKDIVI